jgi:hypothetical protein
MRGAYRVRLAANLLNGSTAAGLLVAAAGRARLTRAGDGLMVALRYRLPVPPAPAFCLGNVIVTRLDADGAGRSATLLRHEARHATQFACCGGVLMLPLYFLAAGLSWLLTGDFAARNIFERRAGLADGGYAEHPLRPAFARRPGFSRRPAAARAPPAPWPRRSRRGPASRRTS